MDNWLLFFQKFLQGCDTAIEFLNSKPFDQVVGLNALWDFTPLMLISLTGLVVFIGVAIVKWVVS